MSLSVAVLSRRARLELRGTAAWGSWGVFGLEDVAALATEPWVVSPDTDACLVLAPAREAERAHLLAATLAAVRPGVRVRVRTPATSVAALTRAVERVGESATGANEVDALVARHLRETTRVAWVRSLHGLEDPAPGLLQHAVSLVAPGAGYLVVPGDGGWIQRLPVSNLPAERRLTRSGRGEAALEAQVFGEAPEDAVAAVFAMGLTHRPTRRDPVGDLAQDWGTARAAEIVIHPAAEPLGPADGGCPACRQPVWGTACPFCHVAPEPVAARSLPA